MRSNMLSLLSRNGSAIRAKSQLKAMQSITIRSFSIGTCIKQNNYTKDLKKQTFPTLINTNRSFGAVATRFRPTEFSNLVELQVKSCEKFSERPCFGSRSEKGDKYDWISYHEFGRRVQKFRNVLSHHKIGPGDKVAIISNNRVEWAVAFYAVTGVGGSIVPMYEAQMEKDWRFIITDSDSKLIIAANEAIYQKVATYAGTVGKVASVICLDAASRELLYCYHRWMDLVEKEAPVLPYSSITPQHIATIIYTSGTTGNPKGVELSHENLCSNIVGMMERWSHALKPETRALGFLPWAHIFGQTCELHTQFAVGSCLGIVEKREHILEGLQLVKPNVLASVPVLFNRVYDGVMKKINEGSPLSKRLATMALGIARRRNALLERGQPVPLMLSLQYTIAQKVVLSKIKARICDTLDYMPSGGAAVSLPVVHFFEDIGIPICEGYGLTETSPVISTGANNWETRRLGCVGAPLINVTVQILDPETKTEQPADTDGEICVAGPSVMTGYRNNPAANEEVFFHKDGLKFFRTGDLGRMVEGKFLKITGRIKEQYKLENGKYVVPAPLEDAMQRSIFIAQCLLYGDNKKHNVTLIVPEMTEVINWASKQSSITPEDLKQPEKLLIHADVRRLLTQELAHICAPMKSFERPMKWAAIPELFSQENQMLTPKMSLRRNVILKNYAPVIQEMYKHADGFTHGQVEISCGSMGGQGGLKTVGYVTDTLHWDKKGDLPENKGAERVQNSI